MMERPTREEILQQVEDLLAQTPDFLEGEVRDCGDHWLVTLEVIITKERE
jgi:hypothetical protein